MPNAKVLSEKQAIVEALVERINAASAGILVDYQGITVAEDTALRTEMRKEGVDYTVVKNTLTRIAIDKVGMNELDPVLNGSTSMATSTEDPIAPFRIISDYSKKLGDKFNIKAAFMEGKILSEQEIAELSTLTSKNDLYSKLALPQSSPHPLATPAPNPLRSVCPAPVLLPRIPFAQPYPHPFHDLFPCLPCSKSSASIRMRCFCKFPLDKSGKLWYFIISNDNHYCF